MTLRLVLASASPRRRELLALLGIPYSVVPSNYDEPPPPVDPTSLPELVTHLATQKALEVARRLADESIAVIGADTLVTVSPSDFGVPLGKPLDTADAARMLRELSGRTHYVYTGISVVRHRAGMPEEIETTSVRTGVTFRDMSDSMIQNYIATQEPMDKAGAYGAQGYAAPFIEGFQGDFYNVVGLPLCALGKLLEVSGIDWYDHRTHMPSLIG